MVQAASPKVWTAQSVIDRVFFGDDSDISGSVHENLVSCEELFRFIEIHHHLINELAALVDPTRRQIAAQTTNTGVRGGESRAGKRFAQIVNFFALGKGVQENR